MLEGKSGSGWGFRLLRRPTPDKIVDNGDQGVQALIGVPLGCGEFLDCGIERHGELIHTIREQNLSREQLLMFFAKLDVVVDQERHQSFQAIEPGLA